MPTGMLVSYAIHSLRSPKPASIVFYHMVDPHRKDLMKWAALWDKDTANGKKLGALSLVFMA